MRKRRAIFNYITLFIFCQVLGFWGGNLVLATSVDDFYFKDFTADYYLSRDEAGISHLKVVEELTAVFPDYDQNKGICREITSTNWAGKNVTLPRLEKKDITVLRNGEPEPIYSITKNGKYYRVCTGTDDYMHGEQIYTFEYEQSKVITEFYNHQELYWDVNGNEWRQRFDTVTARVHLDESIENYFNKEIDCYVGEFGEIGEDRCEVSKLFDGIEFRADNLDAYETLTFVMGFKAGAFVVPPPEPNYLTLIILGVIGIICVVAVCYSIKEFVKVRKKRQYYRNLFIKPEYQPEPNYSLAEMAEVYIGKKQNIKVGIILDLIVRKRIKLLKSEQDKTSRAKLFSRQKNNCLIEILISNIDNMVEEERILLQILNNGNEVNNGNEIKIERHLATKKLVDLGKKFDSVIKRKMESAGLVNNEYEIGQNRRDGKLWRVIIRYIIVEGLIGSILVIIPLYGLLNEFGIGLDSVRVIDEETLLVVLLLCFFITFPTVMILRHQSNVFKNRTLKGLELSRYMDGLKMYIKMAEADRMKFLQSVENVDVSPEGVVKIYKKLLPYAAIFGLEESWMNEMQQYCELNKLPDQDWVTTGLIASEISRFTNYTSDSIDGSSGFSSSSSSGLGGGGFAGGGGGGGGGGGR